MNHRQAIGAFLFWVALYVAFMVIVFSRRKTKAGMGALSEALAKVRLRND
jgi:hypothetical protein